MTCRKGGGFSEAESIWRNDVCALALCGLAGARHALGAVTDAEAIAANALKWAQAAHGPDHPFVRYVAGWTNPDFSPNRATPAGSHGNT
jgi:hypothetical protein